MKLVPIEMSGIFVLPKPMLVKGHRNGAIGRLGDVRVFMLAMDDTTSIGCFTQLGTFLSALLEVVAL
jgi:hypothetical protein